MRESPSRDAADDRSFASALEQVAGKRLAGDE
jgi:hypothetical protein